MKYIIFLFCFFFLKLTVFSQPLIINWQQCYGGNDDESGYSILKIKNGFLLFCGSYSNDGQVIGNHGNEDYWLIKTDLTGNIEWQQCYGGNNDDMPSKMITCLDGGYLLCGQSFSATYPGGYNGNVFGNHGGSDYWLVKIDSSGTIEWTKCYGGTGIDWPLDIESTADSGFLICGWSNSLDGDVKGNHGMYDAWIVRIDHSGIIKWAKSFGGSNAENANSIISTADGGFIFCGWTGSQDGDVQCNFHGRTDTWVVKCDSIGNIEWQKCYGGSDYEGASAIIATPEGGYIFVASTDSDDGDVTGNHGGGDIWVVKIDHEGNIIWQKCFGGSLSDAGYFIKYGNEGSFLIGGYTTSNDGDVLGNHSIGDTKSDMWLIKISSEGTLFWQCCLGGGWSESLKDLCELPNGQMILIGGTETSNNTGDVQCNHHGPGTTDVWFLSVTDTTEVGIEARKDNAFSINTYPNPATDEVTFQYSFSENIVNTYITIYNALGVIIQQIPIKQKEGKITWDISDINSGLYYYFIKHDELQNTGKFVILR